MTTKNLDKREHLLKLVQGFDTGMLATRTPEGRIHGRPMQLAEVGARGEIYMPTELDSPKIDELKRDPHASLFLQGKASWVTLNGELSVSKDRALIDRLWTEDWKVWFPNGKDDPKLCILTFDTTAGEYWDNTGSRGVAFVIETARAYFEGRQANAEKDDEHAKVKLR